MNHEHIPSCVSLVPVFQVLPRSELLKLGKAMEHKVFNKGEILYTAGSRLDHLVVVVQGRLHIVHTTNSGRQQIVRSLEVGEFLGELALFYTANLEGNVIAAEDSVVCLLARKAVQEVLEHPGAAMRLVEALARRLAKAENLIADLGLKDVGQRLATEILRLASTDTGQEITEVAVPVPWSRLAVKLGTTPETISRRLGELADQGLIRLLDGRRVLITDVKGLRKKAGN
jgi:CRP-like cAMP-binding protein